MPGAFQPLDVKDVVSDIDMHAEQIATWLAATDIRIYIKSMMAEVKTGGNQRAMMSVTDATNMGVHIKATVAEVDVQPD